MTKPLLFTPITIREVTLKNRVVVAPMATYAAVDGIAQDFHFAHWGRLVLGGAGLVFVEATAVTDQGRITNLGKAIDEEAVETEVTDTAFELSSRSVRVLHRQGGEAAQPSGMARDECCQGVVRSLGDVDRLGRIEDALSARRVE